MATTGPPRAEVAAPSFWLETTRRAPGPALEGAVGADVAILGGGFTGLAAAWFLKRAQPELRLAVLEAETVGSGSSGRCAGIATTGFGPGLSLTAALIGREQARQAHLQMEQAVELVERLVLQNRIDCDYERPGLLRVATTPALADRLQDEVRLAERLGLKGIEWQDGPSVRRQLEGGSLLGAWWEPRCGLLDPAKLLFGMRDLLLRSGVAFYEGSPAVGVRAKLGKLYVQTPRGGILAEKVVVALNAYSDALPRLRRRQIPVTAYALVSERLPPAALDQIGWQRRQAMEEGRHLCRSYRLTRDGRVLVSGRDARQATGPGLGGSDAKLFRRAQERAQLLFPALRGLRFPYRWAGPVSVPMQPVPALGCAGDRRIVFALGCTGHGLALSHLNGWTLADLVREERTERTESFFVNRRLAAFPPGPARAALAFAARALLGAEDFWNDRFLAATARRTAEGRDGTGPSNPSNATAGQARGRGARP